ncbi:MAG: (d)CMP kinase [Ferruginibacter sp.]|nr:(d)CMP kinase [Cytophagales bacterium]
MTDSPPVFSPHPSQATPRTPAYASPKITIAIDGYSAVGKSTTAKLVAAQLGYAYVDTGAMYRAVTLYFHNHRIGLIESSAVQSALDALRISFVFNSGAGVNETYLNGRNVEGEIRKMYISDRVSEVSALPEVRRAMVRQQQEMGKQRGLVMDGRDIGTKVFPDAELKIFMNADLLVRAERRQLELRERNESVPLPDIIENLTTRDRIDTTRKESPLVKAADAYEINTTHMTIEEQVEYIFHLAAGKIVERETGNRKPETEERRPEGREQEER